MDLTSLVTDNVLVPQAHWDERLVVSGVSLDSRKVEQNELFIAIPGVARDGTAFIGDAFQKGAKAAVVAEDVAPKIQAQFPHKPIFATANVREFVPLLASRVFKDIPSTLIAVTGTNGKSSIVSFLRQLWYHMGTPAASMGTLGVQISGISDYDASKTHLTTPDALSLWRKLQDLKSKNIDHVALEASSHGIHQSRLDHLPFKAAIFTNFTNDHLDYHKTMDAYFEAKERLFKELMTDESLAILNADVPEFERLKALCDRRGIEVISYGVHGREIKLLSQLPSFEGQDLLIEVAGKTYNIQLPLVGQFQVMNVLAAVGGLMAVGENINQVLCHCASLKGVPGRLERVVSGVYVDYAHTPAALETVLKSLRPHTEGRLILVFGCGGERDASKRPMMGLVAQDFADIVYVTDDNPRHEDPDRIRAEIMEACPKAFNIPGREAAIRLALLEKEAEDIVLIAGKGHEGYQTIGDENHPFSDTDVVLNLWKDIS